MLTNCNETLTQQNAYNMQQSAYGMQQNAHRTQWIVGKMQQQYHRIQQDAYKTQQNAYKTQHNAYAMQQNADRIQQKCLHVCNAARHARAMLPAGRSAGCSRGLPSDDPPATTPRRPRLALARPEAKRTISTINPKTFPRLQKYWLSDAHPVHSA